MRFVRGAIYQRLLKRGFVPLHSSAVCIQGTGVLFVGPKLAGKTTLMLSALKQMQADFVANDLLLFRRQGVKMEAVGLPTSLGIRPETALLFDLEQSYFLNSAKSPDFSKKVFLDPFDFCKAMGARFVSFIQVDFIFFPKFVPCEEAAQICSQSASDVSHQLSDNLLKFAPWKHDYFIEGTRAEEAIDCTSSTVNGFELFYSECDAAVASMMEIICA